MKRVLNVVRVYDIAPAEPGYRVLVDRLWPRGVLKEALHPDLWAKDIAPSTELRKWFGHDKARFGEFARLYRNELDINGEAAAFAKAIAGRLANEDVLLLYAAKNPNCNHAIVLRDRLNERMTRGTCL